MVTYQPWDSNYLFPTWSRDYIGTCGSYSQAAEVAEKEKCNTIIREEYERSYSVYRDSAMVLSGDSGVFSRVTESYVSSLIQKGVQQENQRSL